MKKGMVIPVLVSFLLSWSMMVSGQEDNTKSVSTYKGPRYGTGEDSVKCIEHISLYYEFYKQWKQSDYKNQAVIDALGTWRYVFLHCPQASVNTFIHGLKIMNWRIENETDKDKREKLIDTLMIVYDKRIEFFGDEDSNLGRKGTELYKLRPDAFEECYTILKKSIELQGNETEGAVLVYYFRIAEKMVKAEKQDKSILVDIYDKASEIIDFNLKKYKDDQKQLVNWENYKGNIELSFEPYATCEDLIQIYSVKFEQNPNELELLKKITKILDKKKCTDSELFFKATENLHKLEPSAKTAYLMGKMNLKKEDFSAANNYLLQAVDLLEDEEDKANALYYLALINTNQKNYQSARNYCLQSLKYKPNDGNPYILIGDLYAATAADCGDNDLTKRAAYWAAVDKYIKAKNVDPSVAEIADKKIATYSQHFPLTETIFFYDLKKGDSYQIGCWINETTTIRTAD